MKTLKKSIQEELLLFSLLYKDNVRFIRISCYTWIVMREKVHGKCRISSEKDPQWLTLTLTKALLSL